MPRRSTLRASTARAVALRPRRLIGARRIARRVSELGGEIARAYPRRAPLLVALLDGAFCFAADLARAIDLPDLRVAFMRASSYGARTESSGRVDLGAMPACRGDDVLVVDDILDSGRTLASVRAALLAAGARRVRTCVLLDKPARRAVRVAADHVGFTIADRFVVGYGLDVDGRWRHLPDICVLEPPTAAPRGSPAGRRR